MDDFKILTSYESTEQHSSTSSPIIIWTPLDLNILPSSPRQSQPDVSTFLPGNSTAKPAEGTNETLPYDLTLTRIALGPCGVVLLLSTVLLFYLVLKHFTSLIKLYFSPLLYAVSQVFLVIVLFFSTFLQGHISVTRNCQIISVFKMLATMMPGYGVLLISGARWVCASYPLRYKKILDLRVQVVVVGVVLSLLTLLSCLPLLGVCQYSWMESDQLKSGGYCTIGTDNPQCSLFRWILVGVGYILPFLGVIVLFSLIIRVLVRHKQAETKPGIYEGKSTENNKVDYKYKPVTISEKLSQLRAMGQDAIPWSIVVILVLDTVSSLLWIPNIFLPHLYYETRLNSVLILDITNCLMILSVSVSPIAYILTTPPMRNELSKIVKNSVPYKMLSNRNVDSTKLPDI